MKRLAGDLRMPIDMRSGCRLFVVFVALASGCGGASSLLDNEVGNGNGGAVDAGAPTAEDDAGPPELPNGPKPAPNPGMPPDGGVPVPAPMMPAHQ